MPKPRLRPLLVGVVVLLASLAPRAADTIDQFDRRITAELRARDAAAAALFEQANAARARGDHAAAMALYRQVRAAQPTFTHATRRLAGELMQANQADEGLALLREAAATDPSPLNMAALALGLVQPRGASAAPEAERTRAVSICRDLLQRPASDTSVEAGCARVALATNTLDLLVANVSRLEGLEPSEADTLYLASIAHAIQGELLRADLDLWKARRGGLPEEEYLRLRRVFHAAWPWWLTLSVWTAVAVAAWVVVMMFLLAGGLVLSRATLAEAGRVPGAMTGSPLGPRAVALRRVYAGVLGVTGTAYYLSLPLLFVVVVLLGGGLVLAMLAVGHVPVNFLVITVLTVVWSCWSIIKSLKVFGADGEPGVPVDLAEHARLNAVLKDVASEIGTSPIDSVYLLPGTDFAVMERGGLVARVRGDTRRCLLLGVGVLEGFRLRPFKAVLAHEYGHFVNRDTAGGGFSLSVRRSMMRMAQSLAPSGYARFSPAWLFLIVFVRLFERISQGASRLQEVMADRWAVAAYGSQAFCEGLRHVIERSTRFGLNVHATFSEMQQKQAVVDNLYTHRPALTASEEDVQQAIGEVLNRQPSAYDSHPSPNQRFEWASRIAGPGQAGADEGGYAWALFGDKTTVERAMTAHVLAQV